MATLAVDDGVRRDDLAAADEEIGRDHVASYSMAQPPSTGRSTPVIWRDASLARNRQALATSASVVTRLSAYSAGVALGRLLDGDAEALAMSAQTLSRKRGPSTMPGATQLTLMLYARPRARSFW